jgi:hyperosmotically inducible periplasmic protein
MNAMKMLCAVAMLLILLLVASPMAAQNTPAARHAKTDENLARAVHHQLLRLPYYSVFDHLVFTIDGDSVTLSGQVVRPTLKENAEAAVKSIEGVGTLVNLIEVLPKSPSDDELRREVYRIIFEDTVLKQYAVQAIPPVHIIVKNGAVALEGIVNSKSDKDLAEKRAGSVVGVQNLTNHLLVHQKESAAK